jgi:peroxiredoxin Q/BCP
MKSPFIYRVFIVTVCSLIMKLPFVQASDLAMVGTPAPTPPAIDQDGNPFDFAALYSKGITLVYFYPKADTPGCTAQACSLRDGIEDLKKLGVQVVGVSKDTPAAQKKFKEKYNLPFPLIADTDGKVAEAFGVGRILGFTSRTSFLVKDGKIVWVEPKAGTANHAEQVEAAVKSLGQ